ncbi:MAG: hypothetical protein AABY13_04710 [Nanoarchaeota archaeon]
MGKLKAIFSSPRVVIALIVIVLFMIAIRPNPFVEGVAIKGVVRNTTAALAGIENPAGNVAPRALETITAINGRPIRTIQDYYAATNDVGPNRTLQITTSRGAYRLITRAQYETITLNETETVIIPSTTLENMTVNDTIVQVERTTNTTITRPKTIERLVGTQPLGLTVAPAPTTNIRKGLDLQGGTRVLLTPEEPVSDDVLLTMVDSMTQRLNVFGLSDIIVSPISDLEGNKFILVELAGATESQARDLLAKQGKFEAKIGDATVFRGGDDITYVCRTAECSGIDPNRGCLQSQGGYSCGYFFSISLSPAAARQHARITKDLDVEGTPPDDYLSQNLSLLLDDQLVRQLRIGASLKGSETTEIQISGFGVGATLQQAQQNTLDDMRQLQTVLVTGSLPAKIKIVLADTISTKLGD